MDKNYMYMTIYRFNFTNIVTCNNNINYNVWQCAARWSHIHPPMYMRCQNYLQKYNFHWHGNISLGQVWI